MDQKMIRLRANIKGQLTRFATFVSDKTGEELDHLVVESKYQSFKPLLERFESIQSEMENLASDSETATREQNEERIKFESEYYSVLARFSDLLINTRERKLISAKHASSEPTLGDSDQRVRLPRIELPQFDGTPTEYRAFRDVFGSMIEQNRSLNAVDKFIYLRASLTGEAFRLIQSLPTVSESYEHALAMLKERYDDTRCIKHAYLRALFSLPMVESNSVQSLRNVLDIVNKNVMGLASMGERIEHWNSILVYIITTRLDFETRRLFETEFRSGPEPTFGQLKVFIATRCSTLERLLSDMPLAMKSVTKPVIKDKCLVSEQVPDCDYCKQGHWMDKCPEFLRLNIFQRRENIKRMKKCFKCLRSGHFSRDCTEKGCSKCRQGHHDLLHADRSHGVSDGGHRSGESEPVSLALTRSLNLPVLLFTFMVQIRRKDGKLILARGVVESGSQIDFISSRLLRRLDRRPKLVKKSVDGIGGNECKLESYLSLDLMSTSENFSLPINAYVIDRITSDLPQKHFQTTGLDDFIRNLTLADMSFARTGPVDILLSNGNFMQILKSNIKTFETLKLIDTNFGWIIGGVLPEKSASYQPVTFLINSHEEESFDLAKFWELEEFPKENMDVDLIEKRFDRHFGRDDDGRFVVRLPFTDSAPQDCRYSRAFAMNRFRILERRFGRAADLRGDYDAFMADYLQRGFIEEITDETASLVSAYYLPHHGVVKKDSLTTRLRVVFSGKDTALNHLAINQMLDTGPKLQNDLVKSLLRFRTNKIAFSADIEKMYCMIRVAEEHRDYLRFYYRFAHDSYLRSFRLISLPFGLNCSPFLAIRCLKELGHINIERLPKASRVILNDSYVDDILSGSDDVRTTEQLCRDLIEICAEGGFSLRKWKSNSAELMSGLGGLPEMGVKEFATDDSISKVLGMKWDAQRDLLSYAVCSDFEGSCTKRNILSYIARIFDPLGLLSPVLIIGKVLIQRLWMLKLDWDEKVPSEVEDIWRKWTGQFSALADFNLSRFVEYTAETRAFAFCDASEKAYGFCIYFRSGKVSRLVFAKSRVAPVKVVSLARLELCAAVMCSRAMSYLIECFSLNEKNCFLFSDSKIVLSWISKPAYVWKTFVANRVSIVQSTMPHCRWFHVRSAENPADFVSRGLYPLELIDNSLWWHGPNNFDHLFENQDLNELSTDLESKTRIFSGISVDLVEVQPVKNEVLNGLIRKFSDVERVRRIFAWIIRFFSNLRCVTSRNASSMLSLSELDSSFLEIMKSVQRQHFCDSIRNLRAGKLLNKNDPLISLNPFLDGDSLLRVGGRLRHASLSYNQKHPVILPKGSSITRSIIRNEHIRCNHLGAVGLTSILRQRFWIINSRNTIRSVLRRCFRCFRCHPRKSSQLMGDLPAERMEGVRAFFNTGIDLCGPFLVRPTRKRGNSTTKIYVALFVCMATKAVHLEIVFDLTSDSFISAFRRFCGRRGIPKSVFTDNGTNFVGAKNVLEEWYSLLSSLSFREGFHEDLLAQRIEWKFIPPRSPSFGGLWESQIKSFKTLFVKCACESRVTFEEFGTLMVQVEAALNSRPICGVTESSDDLDSLTPGHFLIGQPLKMMPCPVSHGFAGRMPKRWEYIQELFRNFWRRWSLEYLQNLQSRKVNRTLRPNLSIGDFGLVVDDTLPPLRWRLGRIVQVVLGKDDLVRVVIIKTERGMLKRGVAGFCKFDMD